MSGRLPDMGAGSRRLRPITARPHHAAKRHRWTLASPVQPDLMTHVEAARACRVSPQMIRWWVHTGAWPSPRATHGSILYFRSADVSTWVATGTWPAEA